MGNVKPLQSKKLGEAIESGNWRSIRSVISEGAPPDMAAEDGTTALMAAVALDHKDAPRHVTFLLEHGATVDQRADGGATPLITASRTGTDHELAVVKSLLKAGADVNACDDEGETALIAAAQSGRLLVVKELLAAGANPNAVNKAGLTPLRAVVQSGAEGVLEVVQLLASRGADVNHAEREWGKTALLAVLDNASDETPKLVSCLLSAGADPNVAATDGTTALIALAMMAWQDWAASVMELLLQRGADVNGVDVDGRSALSRVVEDGDGLECAKVLMAAGADVDRPDKNGVTPLMHAAGRGAHAAVGVLLDRGASVKAADANGRTPLMYAVDPAEWESGHLEIARVLIDRGADVNAAEAQGMTVLMCAARHEGSAKLVKYLLDHKADVAATARAGTSVLAMAARSGDLKVVKIVFEQGARHPDAVASAGSEDVASYLLGAGGHVHAVDEDGRSLLEVAVKGGWSDKFVARLLAAGVQPNTQVDGRSLVYEAVTSGSPHRVIEQLLDAGIDPNTRVSGLTALDEAVLRGDSDLIDLLSRHGAKESISYPYYIEAGREKTPAAAARLLKKLRAALRQHAKHLRVRGDIADFVWEEPTSGGLLHRAGVVLRAESSLPATNHVFQAISSAVEVPLRVCDFLTNRGQRYAHGESDNPAPGDSATEMPFDGLLECVRMRSVLESRGLLTANEVDFSVVPVWRILGDCCLREQNKFEGVPGISVAFDGFSQTDDEEDDEDSPTYIITIDTGDEWGPSFYGSLQDCQTSARADFDYIRGKWYDDIESQLNKRKLTPAELEALVRQRFEESTVIDFDALLIAAAGAGDVAMMQQAIQMGADVRAPQVLASARDTSVIHWLMAAGADVNAADADGRTALMTASMESESNGAATVEALLACGASPHAIAADGSTALHQAARFGSVDVLNRLLESGASPGAVDEDGNTALIRAAGREDGLEFVTALVEAGAGPSLVNRAGRSALMEAAGESSERSLEVLTYLLDLGVDVNAADEDGATALMAAAGCWDDGALERVQLLVSRGADGTAKNKEGQTAFDLANGENRALRTFLKKMAAPRKK